MRQSLLFAAAFFLFAVAIAAEENNIGQTNIQMSDRNSRNEQGEGSQRIVFKQYGFSFTCPPGWYFMQAEAKGKRLFDLIRLSAAPEELATNRQALYSAIAARAYAIVYERQEIGSSEIQFARQIAEEIRNQGYELVSSRMSREEDIQLLTYAFQYEQEIWLSVRFFFIGKRVIAFYGAGKSDADTSAIAALFSGVQPL